MFDWPEPHVRQLPRGQAYVYVFPCCYEDRFKLGFSRQPFQRMHTLHRRYFDFFDLDRGFLVQTDSVTDARRLEKELAQTLALHRAQVPFAVRRGAAGHTEWYRGAYATVTEEMNALSQIAGYSIQRPLRAWVRNELLTRRDLLFEWCSSLLAMAPLNASSADPRFPPLRVVRDVLDSYAAMNLDLPSLISQEAYRWYERDRTTSLLG